MLNARSNPVVWASKHRIPNKVMIPNAYKHVFSEFVQTYITRKSPLVYPHQWLNNVCLWVKGAFSTNDSLVVKVS